MGGHSEALVGTVYPLFLAQFEMMMLGRSMAQGQITGQLRDPAELFWVAALRGAVGRLRVPAPRRGVSEEAARHRGLGCVPARAGA